MTDRGKYLTIRASEDEIRMLEDIAERAGLTKSDVLRQFIRREHAKTFGASKPKAAKLRR